MKNPIVIVDNISKLYSLPGEESLRNIKNIFSLNFFSKKKFNSHCALKNISFTINRGERVGVIGKNGAGKSTLLKIIARVTYPTEGKIRIRGTLTSLLEVGTGFNNSLTGRENVYLNASLHGLSHSEIEKNLDKIISFSEIEKFIDTPIKYYSSGMRMRLAFSVAAHLEPDILLLDEVLAVGDMSFQRKCLSRINDFTSSGQTLLLVSHSMDSIMRYCNRCIWLDNGSIRMDGNAIDVVAAYVENDQLINSSYLNKKTFNSSATSSNDLIFESYAKLTNAYLLNSQGKETNLIPTFEEIILKFSYEIFQSGLYVPSIALHSDDGTLLFHSIPTLINSDSYKAEKGTYESLVSIPKHILNIGIYRISIALSDPSQNPMFRYFSHDKIISFQTFEVDGADTSNSGIFPRSFPGLLKPRLDWISNRNLFVPNFIKNKKLDISIDTSGFCNARCETCVWPSIATSKSRLSLEAFMLIIERFQGFTFGEFAFNSINEPFSDKTIIEKISHFIDAKIETEKLFFSSNWLIPKHKTIDSFISLIIKASEAPHIKSISINATISGIDQQSYDFLQAGRRLRNTIHKYKPLSFNKACLNIISLIKGLQSKNNLKEHLMINIKGYGAEFSSDDYQEFWHEELLKAGITQEFIDNHVKLLLNHGFTSFARSLSIHKVNKKRKCSQSWLDNRLVIGPEGGIGLCCQEGARSVNLGSLVTNSISEIISDEKFSSQLALISGFNKMPNNHICQKCEFFIEAE